MGQGVLHACCMLGACQRLDLGAARVREGCMGSCLPHVRCFLCCLFFCLMRAVRLAAEGDPCARAWDLALDRGSCNLSPRCAATGQTGRHIRVEVVAAAHARTHARTHARPQKYMHAKTHTRTQQRTHARKNARKNACAHARTHARTHAKTHAKTHARTHAHTHAHTPPLPLPHWWQKPNLTSIRAYLLLRLHTDLQICWAGIWRL